MFRRIILTVISIAFSSSASLSASLLGLPPDKLCIPSDSGPILNKLEVMNIVLDGVPAKDIDGSLGSPPDGELSYEERAKIARESIALADFVRNYDRKKFEMTSKNGSVARIAPGDLLPRSASGLIIRCKGLVQKPAEPTAKSKKKPLFVLGENVIIRKDLANFDKDLKGAAPANFSFLQDFSGNNIVQNSEIAVGVNIASILNGDADIEDPGGVFASWWLYNRFVGTFNSAKDKKDVNNLAFGMRGQLYDVGFGSVLRNNFALDVEYLTDTNFDSEILMSNLTYFPTLDLSYDEFNPFGQAQWFLDGFGYLKVKPYGLVKIGEVFDDGGEPNLQNTKEFLRVGGGSTLEVGFGGDGWLSKSKILASFLYMETLEGEIPHFYKFEVGANHQFTSNFGVGLLYTTGRNEDKLDKLDHLKVTFTTKF